jgi:hypothetical protein
MGHDHQKIVAGLISGKDIGRIREAVCVQVEKVYDSCKEKDCIEDAEVIFRHRHKIQWLINNAINVKCRKAEVVDVYSDVEAMPFKRGFFTVDVKFFIKLTLDFFINNRIYPVQGLVVFDKKVMLFGSEGKVKIFKSKYTENSAVDSITSELQQDNLPISKIEVAEPICLNARIAEEFEKCHRNSYTDVLPRNIIESLDDGGFNEDEMIEATGEERHHAQDKEVLASIGLFSIIKLVRNVQLLIPSFDFCVPNKKCIASTEENPCEIFETIEFPVDEFFPPQKADFPRAVEEERTLIEEAEE